MSDTENDPTTHDCGADVAAYALGALEPAEAESFRSHLASCAVCRDELASFEQVTAVLAMSAPQHRAPKALRRRVLGEVARDARATAPRRSVWPWRVQFSLPRPALALGAGLAVAVIVVAGLQLGSSGSSGVRVYQANVTGSTGTAEVRVTGGHAELVLHHFAAPPAGKIYEVWLERPHQNPQPTSALFSVTATGDGDVDVPGSLRGVSLVMVTPEPAGGSPVPTHAPVLSAKVA
jgi:anti-sigma factor RsiW